MESSSLSTDWLLALKIISPELCQKILPLMDSSEPLALEDLKALEAEFLPAGFSFAALAAKRPDPFPKQFDKEVDKLIKGFGDHQETFAWWGSQFKVESKFAGAFENQVLAPILRLDEFHDDFACALLQFSGGVAADQAILYDGTVEAIVEYKSPGSETASGKRKEEDLALQLAQVFEYFRRWKEGECKPDHAAGDRVRLSAQLSALRRVRESDFG